MTEVQTSYVYIGLLSVIAVGVFMAIGRLSELCETQKALLAEARK